MCIRDRVWVESIFVREEYRRQGVAAALHGKAEEIAASYGNDTVYNYVHPNNHRMIEFLRKRGYTVLNLIEIRKPYQNEKPVSYTHLKDPSGSQRLREAIDMAIAQSDSYDDFLSIMRKSYQVKIGFSQKWNSEDVYKRQALI